ncbi:post-GPI attachment to proteins factor 2-like isoform X2 [Pararge aegeria]|uniref:post-GPI attachment to proteins factor 2-like isoform X2 n=1 Tax=Pararge aegeria TaxID=116150 RepID=UPI0019CF654E|nr:post-GPI attachment to proteins factor 2-like isoform X2 [Pararge aegeria]
MGNDAQVDIPTHSIEQAITRTKESCIVNRTIQTLNYKGLLWSCSLRRICLSALWLPLGALVFCYVTASIFQADDIHETHCRVRNLAVNLGEACYWLNLIELLALTGVTYVSNRENYFVHEKIFIIFMVASLLHMLCRARVGCLASDVVEPVRTNKLVWILFFVAIVATIGLIVFFLRHRLLCRPLAFTWFSICEYILATANMAFHALIVQDLPVHELQVVCPTSKTN